MPGQTTGDDNVTFSFSGHESFPLRYAWMTKVVRGLQNHDDLFQRDDALVLLGVGKNMVRAMRHWGLATELLEPPRRGRLDSVSELGLQLFADDGWDPYLEDVGTLWLLHWKLTRTPARASTWHLAFGQFTPESGGEFSRQQLVEWLTRIAADNAGSRATRNSIKRDVDVFVRTYATTVPKRGHPAEDTFDSPLAQLGLIERHGSDAFSFNYGGKETLPDKILLYSLLEYWDSVAPEQNVLPLERIAFGLGSPGAAFKLTENALADRFVAVLDGTGLRFDETAGMRQLIRSAATPELSTVLQAHYEG